MSFQKLKVSDLRGVADDFGVDVSNARNKADIIALLSEEGITYDVYESFTKTEKDDVEESAIEVFYDKPQNPEVTGDGVILVKMDRANTFYQIGEYTFTIEHPFVAMSESDAQDIFDVEEGFRVATPSEVKQYYS